ncbi:hypothetical protein EII34_07930, partial [Arachnia propionica]
MSDGLIDPDAFVCRAEGLDPDAIFEAGSQIWAVGSNISDKVHAVDGVWQELRGVYRSPDEEMVYGVMKRATWPAALIRADLVAAAKAIRDFAEELRAIKPALEQVEQEARAFRAEALEGYLELVGNIYDSRNAADHDPAELAQMGLFEGPLRQQKTHWKRHQHAVDTNNELLARYNQLFEQVLNAARSCENAIRRLGSHHETCLAPAPGLDEGFHELGEYPWGTKVERTSRHAGESIMRGAGNVIKGGFYGFMAHLGMDQEGRFSLDTMGQTWHATGHFWWLTGEVVIRGFGVQRIGEEDPEYTAKLNEAATLWGDMIKWDHQAHLAGENGWHAYEEDPVQAWTETILGAGVVGAGSKLLLRGARVPRGLPSHLAPGIEHVAKTVDTLTQPLHRFRQGVTRFGVDHVITPLEERLRHVASQAKHGLENLTDPWRNTVPAGAHTRGGGGAWNDHTTFNQAHNHHGGGHHTPDLDQPTPRRAAPPIDIDTPDAEPPRRTDRYGNDLSVDHKGDPVIQDRGDGRLHYASDPEGTFRDTDNPDNLRNPGGKFNENPYAPPPGEITHPATWQGELTDQPLSNIYDNAHQLTESWDAARDAAAKARDAAAGTPQAVKRWIPEAENLTNKELIQELTNRIDEGDLDPSTQAHLETQRDILRHTTEKDSLLRKISEWAGDYGGQRHLESQGRQVISGRAGESPDTHVSPGRDELDQTGISGPDITPPEAGKDTPRPKRYEITFQENKGGNISKTQLGTRGGAQQGSLPYLTSILEAQNPNGRFLGDLKRLKTSGQYPGFFKALERGEVIVRYQYTNTRTNGTLRTGEFNLGPEVRLHWDGN